MDHSLGAFVFLCFLLTITPGADTALVLKSALSNKRRSFFLTTLGICTGLLFHATLSSLGISAVLYSSPKLYSILKFLGAGYLIFLGARGIYEAFFAATAAAPTTAIKQTTALSEFRTGLLTNILNPKVAVFYLTFLPQFVNVENHVFLQSIALASIHVAICFIWLNLIGYFVDYFRTQLMKPSIKQKIETITGLALLGFGLRLALSK